MKETIVICPGCEFEVRVKTTTTSSEELDQERVRLAGCLMAAEGGEFCEPGDYGWSPAGQAVADLRVKYDELVSRLTRPPEPPDQSDQPAQQQRPDEEVPESG